jgi:hypothetical protein
LTIAYRYICALLTPLTRRLQYAQTHRVYYRDYQRALFVSPIGNRINGF